MEKGLVKFLLSAALLCAPAVICSRYAPFEASAAARVKKQLQTVVFKTHLHCENCVKKVVENISYVKGVEDLKVSLENQTIVVTYDANKTDAGKLAKEINDLGYPAVEVKEHNQ